jgi:hypothetical protein
LEINLATAKDQYVKMRIIYTLKDIAKEFGALNKIAKELAKYNGSNLKDDVIDKALLIADQKSESAIRKLNKMKADTKGFLRRI